jgi:hypothetical protein
MHETDRTSKYREGKMKRTLKIELKDPEIVRKEPYQPRQMVGGNPPYSKEVESDPFTTGMLATMTLLIGGQASV